MTFPKENPEAFLEAQGWPLKRAGKERITTCPFCSKAEHFYMNADSGLWKCQRCGESGNLSQLRQRLGLCHDARHGAIQSLRETLRPEKKRIPMAKVEAMHRALVSDEDALAYCTKIRRWSLDLVGRMSLGLRVDDRGKWIAYPWLRRGECVGMKFRILPAFEDRYPARFDREPGCESVLFNVDALDRFEEVLLASGESDGVALLTLGFENTVATTTGESGLPATAVDALSKKAKVFVLYDADAPGQKGAREIAKRIGLERTWLVPLPTGVKDVNEFLIQGGTRDRFDSFLAASTQIDVPTIVGLAQALDRLEAEKAVTAWDDVDETTPWPSVNQRVGRWRDGNLIVLSGPQGTGKTTWALNVASARAAHGQPALVYCLEMTVEELVQHVLCAHYRLTEDHIRTEVIDRARRELVDWPLYLGSNPRLTSCKDTMDLLGQAVSRYGLRLLVFDNLHMLARSVEYRHQEVGAITKTFKFFAMEREIPIILIAQPRKLSLGRVMTPWDLKDSVDIYSDADQVILLHRELTGSTVDAEAVAKADDPEQDQDNFKPFTLVRVAKARHKKSTDALLYFVGEEHRFREIEPGDRAAPENPSLSEDGAA